MRLVVDTNVLVSAFLWQGTPGRLIDLAGEKEISLYTSRALVDELSEFFQLLFVLIISYYRYTVVAKSIPAAMR